MHHRTPLFALPLALITLTACGHGGAGGEGGSGGGSTTTITVTVTVHDPPVMGAVPCPDEAASRCQAWYGEAHSGVICTADDGESPLTGCLRANAGVLPAVWCCPPPPSQGDSGDPFEEPKCDETACTAQPDALQVCNDFVAPSGAVVPHCVTQNAFLCVPRWDNCAVYSPGLLCCSN